MQLSRPRLTLQKKKRRCLYGFASSEVRRDTPLPVAWKCQKARLTNEQEDTCEPNDYTLKPMDQIQLRGLLPWAQDSLLVQAFVDSGAEG